MGKDNVSSDPLKNGNQQTVRTHPIWLLMISAMSLGIAMSEVPVSMAAPVFSSSISSSPRLRVQARARVDGERRSRWVEGRREEKGRLGQHLLTKGENAPYCSENSLASEPATSYGVARSLARSAPWPTHLNFSSSTSQ